MLTTLTWWGIGSIISIITLTILISGFKTRNPRTMGTIGAFTATLLFCGFVIYINIFLGVRVILPSISLIFLAVICWVWFAVLVSNNPEPWKPQITGAIITVSIMTTIQVCALFGTLNWWSESIVEFYDNPQAAGKSVSPEETSKSTLVRSKLIEQNTQHTEADGETFLGAGSFTMRSDSDLKVYHVWQERDESGVLHVNVAQDGEGKDDKNRDKAVIKDDVPKGTEPYVERIPVYATDPLLVKENDSKLCVENQDTNCRINAKHSYNKIIIHVPVGSVVPSVDPNLPVNK